MLSGKRHYDRDAPEEDVAKLKVLKGIVREGRFVTKFRKVFTRGEMGEDLLLQAARLGDQEDRSEYQETLPTSPP